MLSTVSATSLGCLELCRRKANVTPICNRKSALRLASRALPPGGGANMLPEPGAFSITYRLKLPRRGLLARVVESPSWGSTSSLPVIHPQSGPIIPRTTARLLKEGFFGSIGGFISTECLFRRIALLCPNEREGRRLARIDFLSPRLRSRVCFGELVSDHPEVICPITARVMAAPKERR